MKIAPHAVVFLLASLGLTAALPLEAQTVQYFLVEKVANYDQTAFGTVQLDASNPYGFAANVTGSSLSSLSPVPSFNSASGSTTTSGTLSLNSGGDFSYKEWFTSKTALNGAFLNGTYSMSFGASTNLTLGLTPEMYPTNIPQVTSTLNGATWNNSGQLVIDAATGDTLNINSFSAYTSGGHMSVSLTGNNNTVPDSQAIYLSGNGHTDAAITSYAIPANALVSGQTYTLTLDFDSIVGTPNTSGPSGSLGSAAFGNQTTFTILAETAIPEPATDALGLAAAALLAVLLLRRRQRCLA